jgi:tetratricopeptide (TPR) repeat protein
LPRKPSDHVDDPVAVGKRLREARLRAGLSQRDLSFDGCTSAYVSRIEAGARVPSLQILQAFGRKLGVSASYLAEGETASDRLEDAELAARLDDVDAAKRLFRETVDDDHATPKDRARALAALGDLALRRGDHREAIGLIEEALDLRALSRDQAAAAADRLGRAYMILGEHESAIGIWERQLADASESQDELATLRFSTLLANVVLDSGNFGRAEELLGHALSLAEKIRDPLDRARLWWTQSRLHTVRNEPEAAARYARLAIDTLEATEHIGYAALAYQLLAHIENDRGNGAAALDLLGKGEAAAASSGNRFYEAAFRLERARALALLGETEEAAAVAMSVTPLLAETSPGDAGRAYLLLGEIFASLGDRARAIEIYELALESLPAENRYLSDVYSALGEALEAEGRTDEALEALKRALSVRTHSRLPRVARS